jgi:dipeptide/tripeptide permease
MKTLIYIGITIGSTAGAFVPGLWHAGTFSLWGIFLSAVGGILGLWGAVKLHNYIEG